MICKQCNSKATGDNPLILNTCAARDPELHRAHADALRSSRDFSTVTPEIEAYYKLLQARKAED